MKKKILCVILCLLFCIGLSACGFEKGEYDYSEDSYFIFQSHSVEKYVDSQLQKEGSYTIKNGILSIDYGEKTEEFNYENNVIYSLSPLDMGFIPDSDRFDATCSNKDGSYICQFYANETFVKTFNLFNIRIENFTGYYRRNGDVITIEYEDGGYTNMYVHEGKLFDTAYVLKS